MDQTSQRLYEALAEYGTRTLTAVAPVAALQSFAFAALATAFAVLALPNPVSTPW